MNTHTPTPWQVGGADIVSPSECAVVATVQWCGEGRDGEGEANAAHIVRCVNAHDELVAALRYITEWYPDGWSPETARDMARAALAKAGAL